MNDTREWDKYIPPPLDVASYQERINTITGLSPGGNPILWLRWTHEVTEERFGAKVFRYGIKDGTVRPFIPPRWVLEQRSEPEQYWDSWQATRYQTGPDGEMRDRGAPPKDGWYAHLKTLAHHNDYCCEFKAVNYPCPGMYRAPDEAFLQEIGVAHATRDYIDPRAPMSDYDMRRVLQDANTTTEERKTKRHAMNARICYEFARDYLKGVTPMSYAETKSGLLVPESVIDANRSTDLQ